MTWRMGSAVVQGLLDRGELDHVAASDEFAARLISAGETHLRSAELILPDDAPGAFQLAYDAARKSCEGLLAAQGLRSTQEGGHVATADAVRAQFNGPRGHLAFATLHHLRRQRAGSEYPKASTPPITNGDARALIDDALEIVAAARAVFASGRLTTFRS